MNTLRFRAGLPEDWVIADKTGTGDYGAANDVGIVWTSRGTPISVAVLTVQDTRTPSAMLSSSPTRYERSLVCWRRVSSVLVSGRGRRCVVSIAMSVLTIAACGGSGSGSGPGTVRDRSGGLGPW